jgi:hypothetical protein
MLIVVTSELFLMGGGRLVEIGPLTLRMVLFGAAQIYTIVLLFKRKIDPQALALFLYFIASLLLAAFIGFSNGADSGLVLEDIKPLSFFTMVLFFSIFIDNRQRVVLVAETVKVCSVILMTVYFLLLVGIYFKLIDFVTFYNFMDATGEVSFRPEVGFFYKGFLYLCVGCLFFLFSGKKADKFIAVLLLLSLIMTFTRGFLLSTGATVVIYMFAKKNAKILASIAILIVFTFFFAPWFITQLGDKSTSDLVRVITYQQVKESLTPFSILFGHGLGIGVEERTVHMEASYLEIFHKQGVVGLSPWLLIFLLVIWSYSKISDKENRTIALPFVLSMILIYIQTVTNPFLNNPIGMSMVLITLCVVRTLRYKAMSYSSDVANKSSRLI